MKNSKRNPVATLVEEHFLSHHQLSTCRTLFQEQTADLALTVIDLNRLQAGLAGPRQSLAAACLDPSEQERLASFQFPKRQLEWLGGRLAAKHAALSLSVKPPFLLQDYKSFRIGTEVTGRPFLSNQAGPGTAQPAISISHSGNYAGALAVAGQSCGLDLQRIMPKVISVRDRFADRAELELISASPALQGQGESALLTLLWSAKEAFRKAIACQPLVGFTEVTLCRLEGDPQTGLIGHFSCPRLTSPLPPAFLVLRDDFACAITVIGS